MEVTVAAKAFFQLLYMLRKTKFPNHPLWQNSLYTNELFIDYKGRMIAIAAENNDPANALLQRCVPILQEKIKLMHADLSTRLDSQVATQARTNDYITRLVTGQATISLNISLPDLVDGQQRPYTSTISSTAQPPPAQEDIRDGDARTSSIRSSIQTNSVPSYSMSRGILTITDLWREWTEGLCGGHTVIDLERRWEREEIL